MRTVVPSRAKDEILQDLVFRMFWSVKVLLNFNTLYLNSLRGFHSHQFIPLLKLTLHSPIFDDTNHLIWEHRIIHSGPKIVARGHVTEGDTLYA